MTLKKQPEFVNVCDAFFLGRCCLYSLFIRFVNTGSGTVSYLRPLAVDGQVFEFYSRMILKAKA